MAVFAEDRVRPTLIESIPAADPAPLGLAAFALTTFILSGHNASFIPDIAWLGLAFFYGGLVQLLAGMWEFRNRNVFGATAFSTYGGFWMALGFFVTLVVLSKTAAAAVEGPNLLNGLAWFLLAFAIFNFYMLLWSTRVSVAVCMVFLTLQITEVLLCIGFFREAHGGSAWVTHAGGWAGIVTAAVAWYASAAGVVNGMSAEKPVLPVGAPIWGRLPVLSRLGSPMPRHREA
jgi:succinate-acetate transporter protein